MFPLLFKDLTWLLFAPNLTHLELESLEKIEEVISEEKAASSPSDEQKVRGMNAPFQKLERLDLPMLKRIYWSPLLFPCLKKIVVEKCPKLRKLPLNSESCVAGGEELVINYRDE
ncbi:unnamed protein product [Microthlaspi erraticum]|uniref:Uncharacterized protein n=1 Tax=Microthlaspi erraticum TaxID=1685480 RepID=A0A6D2IFU7_9BRAS|nr:unnamed protein product [Microthlaspi erraticum]